MATIKKFVAGTNQFGGFSPFGNMTVLNFGYSTSATGAVISSDSTTPVAIGDKIYVGAVPQGFSLCSVIGTAAVGFEYVDGTDDASVPQGADIKTALLKPLPKDAYVYITASAAATAASTVRAALTGELTGPR